MGNLDFPRMELDGAGLATFISRLLLFIVIIFLVVYKSAYKPYLQHVKQAFLLKVDGIKEILRVGVPSAVQYGMEAGAFAVSGVMSGWLGYIQQAAHQIALNMAAITYMVSLGISSAGSIRVANARGQGNVEQVKKIGYSNFTMAAVYGLICAFILFLGRNMLPQLFNNEMEVLTYTTGLMILAGIFQISDSTQAVGIGLLRGVQDMKIPTFIVLLAYWIVGIPVGYFLAFQLKWEVYGLWVGFIVGLSSSALLLFFRFRHKANK